MINFLGNLGYTFHVLGFGCLKVFEGAEFISTIKKQDSKTYIVRFFKKKKPNSNNFLSSEQIYHFNKHFFLIYTKLTN